MVIELWVRYFFFLLGTTIYLLRVMIQLPFQNEYGFLFLVKPSWLNVEVIVPRKSSHHAQKLELSYSVEVIVLRS